MTTEWRVRLVKREKIYPNASHGTKTFGSSYHLDLFLTRNSAHLRLPWSIIHCHDDCSCCLLRCPLSWSRCEIVGWYLFFLSVSNIRRALFFVVLLLLACVCMVFLQPRKTRRENSQGDNTARIHIISLHSTLWA
jgi:hypothetical protein